MIKGDSLELTGAVLGTLLPAPAPPQASPRNKPFDFDYDGKADPSVWQANTTRNWVILKSSNGQTQTQPDWGNPALGDQLVPGDYDGDKKTDCAIWRPSEGNWYIVKSSNGTTLLKNWGSAGDKPVPGDYDGDGKTDVAVFRPSDSNWYIIQSSDNASILRSWGAAGDEVVPNDFDGDGKTDAAVYRPAEGNWYIQKSTTGTLLVQWGGIGDKLVPADYDGDGKADVAVFRPAEGNWYIKRSSDNGVTLRNWGNANDLPVAADYDGDGKADIAIWRASEGNWYIIQSSNGSVTVPNLGASTDFPVPSAYVKTVVPPPNQPPTANAGGPYTAIPSYTLQLDGSHSSDADGQITSYQWNFGDGTSGTGAKPKHSYSTAGTKTLTLTVTDDRGGTATATVTANVLSSEQADFANARLDPMNSTGQAGENPLSRNFNWSLPLLGLPGRAGLDLGLSLSYNSLVWTKAGNYIAYDLDHGTPGPGFRLGFPVIQKKYHNIRTNKDSYLMIMRSGSRVELRQVGATNMYEAADSSYLQLIESGGLVVRATDGTQLSYALNGDEYLCAEVKDRNGNFITIGNNNGRLTTITDTLGRTITFNYDADGYLTSITQPWGQQPHYWARFTYSSPELAINTSFTGLTVIGPQNSTTQRVLTEVKLADNSSYKFLYSSYGQVARITHYAADNHPLAYSRYDLDSPGAQDDCPRFTAQYDWAENWNNNQEVMTSFAIPASASWMMSDNTSHTGTVSQVTTPDGTIYKVFSHSTGWDKGLPMRTETWAGGTQQRWTTTNWTQDNTSLSYLQNPRANDMSVYDGAGNRRRTDIVYHASFGLPYIVREYAADAVTILRQTYTGYRFDSTYLDLRIIGLVSAVHVVDENNHYVSKTTYEYDAGGEYLAATAQPPTQHDANYGASYTSGRGNVTAIYRWDATDLTTITDLNKTVRQQIGYNTTGAVVFTRDPRWQQGQPGHQVNISYADSFADDNNGRNTFAYPTTVTDADGFSSTVQYNFEFGATTRTQTPPPQGFTEGPVQTFEYDSVGRGTKVNTRLNNSIYRYTRWEYPPSQTVVNTFTTIQDGAGEAYSTAVLDGAGRVRATASELPNSAGGYSGQLIVYDAMGRVWKQSNPTETTASGSTWSATGDDTETGWQYTMQTYDWKGRPLITTNADGTTVEASYSGCGCAGGEVITLTDEVGRRQKVYHDVLGRVVKAQVLNKDDNYSLYSTTINSFTALDQVKSINVYQGQETSNNSCPTGTCQQTTVTYDGYGRLSSRKLPEQTNPTTYTYNPDSTTDVVTDARGAKATFGYNNRHLPTSVTYDLSGVHSGEYVAPTANASYSYDAAGNRTQMTDGQGRVDYVYDQLSRLKEEKRRFNGLSNPSVGDGSYKIAYEYNLANELTSVSDPFNSQVNYLYDNTGRLSRVTGAGLGVSEYISQISYRAWGGLKQVSSGNGLTTTYSYNNRLQTTRYDGHQGATLKFGAEYQYFNDGNPSFSHDLMEPQSKFDRSYSYDHMGRLLEAKSGAEARGGAATDDRPYHEIYSYDVWGNPTGRGSRHWTQDTSYFGAHTNNRNTQYSYDADGRYTGNSWPIFPEGTEMITQEYDAAGNNSSGSQQTYTDASGSGVVSLLGYDGDGQMVREENISSCNNCIPSSEVLYYLRSSVLGGQVVTSVTNQAQRLGSYVYANGDLIASRMDYYGAASLVEWRYAAATGSTEWRAMVAPGAGLGVIKNEFDPVGADVGSENPYVEGGGSQTPGGDLTSRYGDASTFHRCYMDGIETPCGPVLRSLQAESSELGIASSVTTVRFRHPITGEMRYRLGVYSALPDGGWGYVPAGARFDDGNWFWVGLGGNDLGVGWVHAAHFSSLGMSLLGQAKPREPDIFQGALDNAVNKTKLLIQRLKPGSKCAKLLGPNAEKALDALAKILVIKPDYSQGMDSSTGIRQIYASDIQVNENNVVAYRLPTSAEVYQNGPFFPGTKGPDIGGYPRGTLGAQITQLLHEIAHNIIPDPKHPHDHLIPSDGDDPEKSNTNTGRIIKNCGDEIFKAIK